MIDIIIKFIGSIINFSILIYCCFKIMDNKLQLKGRNTTILFMIFSMLIMINHLYIFNILKSFLSLIVIIAFCKMTTKQGWSDCILASIISMLLVLISEIIYAILIVGILKIDKTYLQANFAGTLVTNLCIAIICYLIITTAKIERFLIMIFKNLNLKTDIENIITISILFAMLSIIIYYTYFQTSLLYSLIAMIIITGGILFIIIYTFKENHIKNKLLFEYEIISKSLSEYEKMYSHQRKLTHEYKNDLMVIRGMTDPKNKKLLNYIDEIAEFKAVENNAWLDELKRIPEGGLLGIIYYKLTLMEEAKVNIQFTIEDNFSSFDYNKIDDNTKNKVCKLLGIFLDNSLQAINDLEKKNVNMSITQNGKYIIFNIMNNFQGEIDLSKIYNEGYSTKRKGRGHGLAIAKEILEEEYLIENETKIIGESFSQSLKIKLNNKTRK